MGPTVTDVRSLASGLFSFKSALKSFELLNSPMTNRVKKTGQIINRVDELEYIEKLLNNIISSQLEVECNPKPELSFSAIDLRIADIGTTWTFALDYCGIPFDLGLIVVEGIPDPFHIFPVEHIEHI